MDATTAEALGEPGGSAASSEGVHRVRPQGMGTLPRDGLLMVSGRKNLPLHTNDARMVSSSKQGCNPRVQRELATSNSFRWAKTFHVAFCVRGFMNRSSAGSAIETSTAPFFCLHSYNKLAMGSVFFVLRMHGVCRYDAAVVYQAKALVLSDRWKSPALVRTVAWAIGSV